MSDLHEGLGAITEVVGSDASWVVVPTEVIEGSPYKIANLPYDEVAFASCNTVVRDKETGALMIDSGDTVVDLPGNEWDLRTCPAIMRVAKVVGGVVADGFVVDYRRIRVPKRRDLGLLEGVDNPKFTEHRDENRTEFALAAVFKVGDGVLFAGKPEFRDSAESLMRRVDEFVEATSLSPYVYTLPHAVDEVKYPAVIAEPRLSRGPSSMPTAAAEIVRPETSKAPVTMHDLVESGVGFLFSLAKSAIIGGGKPQRS